MTGVTQDDCSTSGMPSVLIIHHFTERETHIQAERSPWLPFQARYLLTTLSCLSMKLDLTEHLITVFEYLAGYS